MKTNPLYQIVYASSAVRPFTKQELVDLLEKARPRNTRANVTGLLLYHDGNFMQLLEGEERQVLATHERIMRDPRHKGAITLMKGPAEKRLFSDWAMAFREVKSADLRGKPGFSEFLTPALPERCQRTASRALVLLMTFRNNLLR